MTQVQIHSEIEKIKKMLINKYQPQKIILFGSFAWGKPNKDSDLDIFIIKEVDQPRPAREQEIYKLLTHYLSDRQLPIDIIVHTPKEIKKGLALEDPFIKTILNSGKILYESHQ